MESRWYSINMGTYNVTYVGTCEPVIYCTVDTRTGNPQWNIPAVTGPIALVYHTRATAGATTTLRVLSDGVSCVGGCAASATLETPLATTGVVITPSAATVLPGTTLHVTVTGAVTMGPFDGSLAARLSAGLGTPTGIGPPPATFDAPNRTVSTYGPVVGTSMTFDTVVSAAAGSTVTIEAWLSLFGSPVYTSPPTVVTIHVASANPPTTSNPTNAFLTGWGLSSAKPILRFGWVGTSLDSTVDHYQLAISTDGAAFATIDPGVTDTSYTLALTTGHAYRARVRAVDATGNIGAWAYGTAFKLTAYQESSRSIHWSGTWRTGTSAAYWGSHERYSSAAGAKAGLTFTGRMFAWVGSVGPSRGWAKVYVNGVLVKSVNLNAAVNANRQVLFATTWPTAKSRTVTIRISGTAGHPRGDLDGFIVGS
jgi:hypothetical protein